MVRVKICGITRKEDLEAAAGAGADAVGFVVGATASPRNVALKTAEELFRQVPPLVKSVLVTVPKGIDELAETCRQLNPDAVQVHGENPLNAALIQERLPDIPLIMAVNANSHAVVETASATAKSCNAVLVDSFVNGQYGGTGIAHDWKLSKLVKQAIHPTPLILAGGLNPESVAEAVRVVQPYAVDVSSGVELRPGIKDNQKMMNFIRNAKGVRI